MNPDNGGIATLSVIGLASEAGLKATRGDMSKTEWEMAVKAGAHEQTMNRLQYHSRKASEEKRARLGIEFESAWLQRIENARVAWEKEKRTAEEEFSRMLTLEELGRLYMLNLGSRASISFWQEIKVRR